jgi:hypothetical protein
MELVDGPSLHDRLQRGNLPPDEALVVLRDVAAGLAHAHRRGVVHRDVKPGNVLLRLEVDRVVAATLSDFGIARRADATRTTAERTVVGTVRFLSPEQARGDRVTAASDVYSLGLTVLAALTGVEAFPGRETESLGGRMVRPPLVPPTLPDGWANLLRGMTALEPADRLDASLTAALACALGSGARPAVTAIEPLRSDAATRPIDVLPVVTVARAQRRSEPIVAPLVGMAVAGAVLGGLLAAVFAPTAIERALSGAVRDAARPATSAPAARAAPARTSAAAAAAASAAAAAGPDDRGGSASGSASSGTGSGSAGHGSDA